MPESKKRSSKPAPRTNTQAGSSKTAPRANTRARSSKPAARTNAGAGSPKPGSAKTAQGGATLSVEALVNRFAEAALSQTDALERGDAVLGEKHAVACSKTFDALRSHGDAGRKALAALFEHENAAVRTTAAVFLLGYCEEEALAVLEAEAEGEGLPAFVAAQALERWEAGDWELDPE